MNENINIDGVKIIPLRQIIDERGKIMHMMKSTDSHFEKFGEIYFSTCWPNTVKAWHIHKRMTVNNAIVSGRAKLVIYDPREDSKTKGKSRKFLDILLLLKQTLINIIFLLDLQPLRLWL